MADTNLHTARLKATATRGITVITEEQEVTSLQKLSLAALSLADEHADTLAIWCICILSELAALPEIDLITRLGPKARGWRDLARGAVPPAFQPIEPEFALKEFFEFETQAQILQAQISGPPGLLFRTLLSPPMLLQQRTCACFQCFSVVW
ncbi:MAG: hypothetical protein ABSE51_15250 [Terracidiphilus sp.]